MLPGERKGRQTLARLKGFIPLSVEQVVEELHVELVILDNEDLLRHQPIDLDPCGPLKKRLSRSCFWKPVATNILKPALIVIQPPAQTPLEIARTIEIDPGRPLLIVDVDEVLAHFMQGFERFVLRHGYEMKVDKFALFQNVYRPGDDQHIDMETGKSLFDDFFRDGDGDLDPVEGAAEALSGLSAEAGIIILTNAPDHGRTARSRWLKTHGLDYPMIINSGLKGPVVAALSARTRGPSGFIDDLLPNLESVADSAPQVARFQIVADARLRPFAPTAPDRHHWADDWTQLEPALRRRLFE